jgi:hypothetical protein
MSKEREAARQYNHLVADVTEDLLCAMEKLGITLGNSRTSEE